MSTEIDMNELRLKQILKDALEHRSCQDFSPKNREELKTLIAESVERSFEHVGLDEDSRKDHQFLRDWRKSCETIKDKSLGTAVSISIVAILGIIAMGLKGWLWA